MMSTENQHTMELVRELADGSEEWVCHTCGRHMIVQWPPFYQRVLLEAGDESASHSGALGERSTGQASWLHAQPRFPAVSLDLPGEYDDDVEDPYLAPFLSWLDDQDDLFIS